MTKTNTLLYVIRCDVFWFQDELNIWNPADDRTVVRERNKVTYPFSFPSFIALWKTGREWPCDCPGQKTVWIFQKEPKTVKIMVAKILANWYDPKTSKKTKLKKLRQPRALQFCQMLTATNISPLSLFFSLHGFCVTFRAQFFGFQVQTFGNTEEAMVDCHGSNWVLVCWLPSAIMNWSCFWEILLETVCCIQKTGHQQKSQQRIRASNADDAFPSHRNARSWVFISIYFLPKTSIINYPLVNCHITMERSITFNG